MRLDVVTRTDPYHKIGSIRVPNCSYRSGTELELLVMDLSEMDPSIPISNTVTRITKKITVQVICQNGVSWWAVPTDKPIEWWRDIVGFVE